MRNILKKSDFELTIEQNLSDMTNLDLLLFASYLDKLKAKKESRVKLSAEQIREMFDTYNGVTGSNEVGVGCSSCVATVGKNILKLKKYAEREIRRRG